MVQFFSKRRLKIVEQIIIVVFFAIIVPMTVSGIIINNVNQQSNRKQLRESATMIANIVSDEIDVVQTSINNELNQIILTMKYYNLPEKNEEYLRTINSKNDFYKELRVMSPYELKKLEENKDENNYAIFSQKIDDNKNLVAILDINKLKNDIFKSVDQNKRQIYVLSASDNHLIASVNFEQEIFENTVKQLPKTLQNDATTVYGNIKNQPIVYHKKTNPDVIIIVNIAIKKNAAATLSLRPSSSLCPNLIEKSVPLPIERPKIIEVINVIRVNEEPTAARASGPSA